MRKGDFVLIPFPFTDLSGSKNRPAIILYSDELDVVVAFISTKLHWQTKTDSIIEPNQKNGLKKTSLIRTSKIMTIDKSLVLGKIGELSIDGLYELNDALKRLLEI